MKRIKHWLGLTGLTVLAGLGTANLQAQERPGGGDGRGGFRGFEPSAEAEALQKAIESKASSEEIKSKLAAYRQSREQKEAKLKQAQEELKKLLSVRQEA